MRSLEDGDQAWSCSATANAVTAAVAAVAVTATAAVTTATAAVAAAAVVALVGIDGIDGVEVGHGGREEHALCENGSVQGDDGGEMLGRVEEEEIEGAVEWVGGDHERRRDARAGPSPSPCPCFCSCSCSCSCSGCNPCWTTWLNGFEKGHGVLGILRQHVDGAQCHEYHRRERVVAPETFRDERQMTKYVERLRRDEGGVCGEGEVSFF